MKMILQSIAIPTVILLVVNFKTGGDSTLSTAARVLCYVLVYITVFVTIWSGLPYLRRLRGILPP